MPIQIKSLLCVLTILLLSTTTHASSKSGEELIEAANDIIGMPLKVETKVIPEETHI